MHLWASSPATQLALNVQVRLICCYSETTCAMEASERVALFYHELAVSLFRSVSQFMQPKCNSAGWSCDSRSCSESRQTRKQGWNCKGG